MKVDYWDVSLNEIEIIDIIQNSLLYEKNKNIYFLLNLNKEKYNYLEKCIYEISIFHLNKLNIPLTDDIFIEFWVKNGTNVTTLHVDCDEYSSNRMKHLPFLSCITYLNDNNLPTLITEIDLEKYKYKNFDNETEVNIIFPKKNTHVSFDGSRFHGMVNIFNEKNDTNTRNILAINFWKTKPTNIPYYIYSEEKEIYNKIENILQWNENINKKDIIVDNVLDYFFYEKILYEKNLYLNGFSDILNKDYIENKICFFNILNKNKKQIIEENIQQKNIIFDSNKRFVFEKEYSSVICDWIIDESEKYAKTYGWISNRHARYPTTDIPIKCIPNVYSFFLFSFEFILKKICKSYNIPFPNINMDNSDMFIVKYDVNKQSELELHRDTSDISINIMLSDSKDYMGGGTHFESDNFVYYLEQGDILVHNGKDMHAGLKITKGTRHLLVMFITF